MNVIEINIDEFSSKLIEIGRQTENEVTQIKIDMSSWLETYPDMAFLVNVSRPTEDYSYPAVFQMEGNYILWTIFSSDTAIEGKGSVEIIGMEVDKKKLSAVARTCIIPCKQEDISEEPPDPFKPYYDDIIEAVDEVKDVKDKIPEIIEAGEKAEQSAESASESANNAEEYAQQAKDALYQIKYVKDVIPPEASITNKLTDRNYVDVQVEEAKSIAKGRATGYVFDTKQDLDNALLDEEFVSKLVLGDNLYIRAIGTPDYWWDGTQAQQLETQKVDLSEYRKSSEQDVIDSGKLDKVST
ncbi:MAG: hypothetical protein KBS91_00660, partial [Firmicutes bacterium]|nr:hypothetical protein [Candidatus Caballimonas caccae]